VSVRVVGQVSILSTSRKEREYPKIGERAYARSPISCPELVEGSGLFQPFRVLLILRISLNGIHHKFRAKGSCGKGRKFVKMKLGVETDITRFVRRNVPRRLAPREEVLVRMRELGLTA
jgi:hypothetical protein